VRVILSLGAQKVKRFYHGGPQGLSEILPAEVTGALSCSDLEKMGGPPPGPHRKDRIYLVTDLRFAEYFAAFAPHEKVSVYWVQPEGEEHDPDCNTPGLGYQALRGKVIAEYRMGLKKRAKLLGPKRDR
jgi:hypothetical protein